MPEVIPDGFAHCTYKFALTGRTNPITFTHGIRTDVAVSGWDFASELFDYLVAAGSIMEAANVRDVFTFESVECIINDGGVLVGQASTQSPVTGTNTTTATPPSNCTLLVQKRTGLIGRKFRGRFYLPTLGLSEGAVDPVGNIDSITFGTIDARVQQWFTDINGSSTLTPMLLHNDATAPTRITSFVTSQVIATQRRRMR
jgi:hypothetical protein